MGRGIENQLIHSLQNSGDMLADCEKNGTASAFQTDSLMHFSVQKCFSIQI